MPATPSVSERDVDSWLTSDSRAEKDRAERSVRTFAGPISTPTASGAPAAGVEPAAASAIAVAASVARMAVVVVSSGRLGPSVWIGRLRRPVKRRA